MTSGTTLRTAVTGLIMQAAAEEEMLLASTPREEQRGPDRWAAIPVRHGQSATAATSGSPKCVTEILMPGITGLVVAAARWRRCAASGLEVMPGSAWATASVISSVAAAAAARPRLRRRGGTVADLPVQCGKEGVQAGQHDRTLDTLTVFPQPGFGIGRLLLTICRAAAG